MNGTDKGLQFVDTNIFLYAYDSSSPEKREGAKKLISELWDSRQGVISTQVLQELYVNMTSKLPRPVESEQAGQIITALGQWKLHRPALEDIEKAIRLEQKHHLSFWDAMIISSALQMKCDILWTEDLNSGQSVDGLVIQNPFGH